jgi:hypothetical protein
MAEFAEHVAEWTRTTGLTRPYVLGGALPNARTFASWALSSDTFLARIDHSPHWEVIEGELSGGDLLTLSITSSSNGNEPVEWPTGFHTVRLVEAGEGDGMVTGPVRIEAPLSGDTIVLNSSNKILIINPAATIAVLRVELPPGIAGRVLRIASRQRIGALTIAAETGEAVDWPVNELPANGVLDFRYMTTISTWVQG